MKQIICKTVYGQDEISVPAVSATFNDGETYTVSDESAALLLSNPNFSEVPAPAKSYAPADTSAASATASVIDKGA